MNKVIKFLSLNALLIGSASLAMNSNPNGELRHAAYIGNASKVRAFLNAGVPIIGNEYLLIDAIRVSNLKLVQEFLNANFPVNEKDMKGRTPLMWAARKGHTRICLMLLDHKALVNEKDNDGNTALMFAAERGHEEICKLLIDHNAQIDAQNNDGKAALQLTKSSYLKCIGRILIDGMLKAIQTSDAIVALLGIKKYRNPADLKLIDTNVIKVIGRQMREPFAYSRQKLIEQIYRIEETNNYVRGIKEELLDYALTQPNPKKQNDRCIIA